MSLLKLTRRSTGTEVVPAVLLLLTLIGVHPARAQNDNSMRAQLQRVQANVLQIQAEANSPSLTYHLCLGLDASASADVAAGVVGVVGVIGTIGVKEFGLGAASELAGEVSSGLNIEGAAAANLTNDLCFDVPIVFLTDLDTVSNSPGLRGATQMAGASAVGDALEDLAARIKVAAETIALFFSPMVNEFGLGPEILEQATQSVENVAALAQDPSGLVDPDLMADLVQDLPGFTQLQSSVSTVGEQLADDPCGLPSFAGEVGDFVSDACSEPLDFAVDLLENLERIADIDTVVNSIKATLNEGEDSVLAVAGDIRDLTNVIKAIAEDIESWLP